MAEQPTPIIDEYVNAPEGQTPDKIHILFDKNTRPFAEQYHLALLTSRNIPPNTAALAVTDSFVLVVANVFKLKKGNEALMSARSYLDGWAYEALKEAWVMALLEDNDFDNVPTPYAEERKPRGIPVLPTPIRNLENPIEYRLKQINDFIQTDVNFQIEIMTRVNDAFARLVQGEESENTDKGGFQPEPVGEPIPVDTQSVDDSDGNRPIKRGKNKSQSAGDVTLAEA